MNLTLSSIIKDNSEQQNSILYKNSSHLIKELNTLETNFIENLKDNINKNISISFSYDCDQCSKIFTSKYGLNYHINMYHSNQSILCSVCNIIFRSHRALKNHQQRFHSNYSLNLSNYNYISSYLCVAFSAQQFSFIAKNACEQGRLPLGEFTSKLFQCHICYLSFPCSNALKYHFLNQHEQYEYKTCKTILSNMILEIEQNLRIGDIKDNDSDDIESIKFLLSKQASSFGLIDKKLAQEFRSIKTEQNRLIFPLCQHRNRTCANLCLKYLSSYNKLVQNYTYKISLLPKGNPFIHGSILSKSVKDLSNNTSLISKENLNTNHKRVSVKRVKSSLSDKSLSPQSKKKFFFNIEQQVKTNEVKSLSLGQTSAAVTSARKALPKVNHIYTRSLSSMSSSSSTSTQISLKNSRRQTASLKRSISPTITLAVERSSEKRRQQREKRKAKNSSLSPVFIKLDDDTEQENDDDNSDIVSIKREQSRKKQRRASNSSVEYVQTLNNDQQSISSLNNIENLKLKSNINDEDIIICHSSSSITKVISSSNRNHSKTSINKNDIHQMNGHQTPDYDEHIRVRCKICGEILEGRSRFSKHVLTMHSHLINNNAVDIKQQQQQTTIVR